MMPVVQRMFILKRFFATDLIEEGQDLESIHQQPKLHRQNRSSLCAIRYDDSVTNITANQV